MTSAVGRVTRVWTRLAPLLGATLLWAGVSVAAEEDLVPIPAAGQPWSVVGARSVGRGGNLVEAGVGWPGLWVGYQRGVSAQLDLGLRGAFTYSQEGNFFRVLPGMKFNLTAKLRLFDSGRVAVGAVFEPGPFFNVYGGGATVAGFSIPLGLRLGIHPASALSVGLTFDVPLWVELGGGRAFYVPILTGLGVEYFIDSALLVFARAKMGPTLTSYSTAFFAMDATLGMGWRI